MSLETPTIGEISDIIISQLESSLSQNIPLLPKSMMRVLSKSLAAVFILLYKYTGFMFLQIFVKTASEQETEILGVTTTPLNEWGRLIGVGDPIAATTAELTADVIVTNQTGSILAGTILRGVDNNILYNVITTVALDSSIVTVELRSTVSGTVGNLNALDIVNFINPQPNVQQSAVVASQSVTAADSENLDLYRERILERFQAVPQGGAYVDLRIWAEEVAGIRRAYPYTSDFPGQVDVFVEATIASSGSPDGIPTPAQLLAVKDSIELDEDGLATRRPANMFVNVKPIFRTEFAVTVIGLNVDDPVEAETDITTEINNYFFNREPFIPGLDFPPRLDRVTKVAVASAVAAIVDAKGGSFNDAIVELSGIGIINYELGQGEKVKASVAFAGTV